MAAGLDDGTKAAHNGLGALTARVALLALGAPQPGGIQDPLTIHANDPTLARAAQLGGAEWSGTILQRDCNTSSRTAGQP